MVDQELERFKTEINLVELAGSYGYECIRKESSRSSVVLVHPDGDKIVVATAPDGHGIFFSVRESDCGGSVLDFVMYRQQVRLGGARQVLRKCLAPGYFQSRSAVHYKPEAIAPGTPALYAQWLRMQPYQESGYLERRGLNAETIAQFVERIRIDGRGNVAFRHDDLHNFSGWELKNQGFTGFSSGGKKALFGCRVGVPQGVAAPLVVVAESAIDVLSYYQLHPQPGVYLSFAGAMSRDQQELLTWVLKRYPSARILIATDNDDQGMKYAAWLGSVRADAEYDLPTVGKDWNDVLNNRGARPIAGGVPARAL
jgi:hypothetical protein